MIFIQPFEHFYLSPVDFPRGPVLLAPLRYTRFAPAKSVRLLDKGIVQLTVEDGTKLFIRHTPLMRTSFSRPSPSLLLRDHQSLRLELYFRFALSFRDVEERLAIRVVSLSYEMVRERCLKFGKTCANALRHKSPRPGRPVALDEAVVKIHGRLLYLWRTVDQDSDVLDILVQNRMDKKAPKRFFRKL